jgi:hypothetical protein
MSDFDILLFDIFVRMLLSNVEKIGSIFSRQNENIFNPQEMCLITKLRSATNRRYIHQKI